MAERTPAGGGRGEKSCAARGAGRGRLLASITGRKRKGTRAGGGRRAPVRNRAVAGMRLTFRAEVMPGRGPAERTFTVARVLGGGRVELAGLAGEHAKAEFEAAH